MPITPLQCGLKERMIGKVETLETTTARVEGITRTNGRRSQAVKVGDYLAMNHGRSWPSLYLATLLPYGIQTYLWLGAYGRLPHLGIVTYVDCFTNSRRSWVYYHVYPMHAPRISRSSVCLLLNVPFLCLMFMSVMVIRMLASRYPSGPPLSPNLGLTRGRLGHDTGNMYYQGLISQTGYNPCAKHRSYYVTVTLRNVPVTLRSYWK